MKLGVQTVLVAAALGVMAPAASAQTANAVDPATTIDTQRDDDDDFPWGLLGLLGLAGLLGRKRDDHVRVDRDNNRRA